MIARVRHAVEQILETGSDLKRQHLRGPDTLARTWMLEWSCGVDAKRAPDQRWVFVAYTQ